MSTLQEIDWGTACKVHTVAGRNGYTLHVHSAGGEKVYCTLCTICTPCKSIFLVVERGALCMSTLLAVEMYTLCTYIQLVV
jgi:hypothetical protein